MRWTVWGLPASVMVVTTGIVTHIWRFGKEDSKLDPFAPGTIVLDALDGVRGRALDRHSAEDAYLQRLRGDEIDHNASDGVEHQVVVEPDGPKRSPVAISAKLRATEERSATLRRELAQHRVHRGRRTLSRGECPVPAYTGCTPGGAVPSSSHNGLSTELRLPPSDNRSASFENGYKS
ncbi:unnamed protein product [Phytophthora fragariaefolia]|uniref:Unnamed protein product n=1 Tax=Phytophthora fragariaefolia TaxID=1490495 RepID=A0A9W7CR85_9STRA|nr:unnamed protein product [Phytophthora fragariaefolia]